MEEMNKIYFMTIQGDNNDKKELSTIYNIYI